MSSQGIFISYRRDDSQGEAGHLDEDLRRRYGRAQVFRDVYDSPPGVSFPNHLRRTVAACRVVIVVVGVRWLEALRARQNRSDDWVRLEIATALHTRGVVVVPVLVQGARMPGPELLPDDIRLLSYITALELSDSRWEYDTGRLFSLLDNLAMPAFTPQPRTGAGISRAIALTCGGILLLGLVIAVVAVVVISRVGADLPIGPGANAAIQLSPTTGPGGANVTVSGSGFQAGETVQVFFQGGLAGQAAADSHGAFSIGVTVPRGLGNFHGDQMTVSAAGKSSARTAEAIFTIQ